MGKGISARKEGLPIHWFYGLGYGARRGWEEYEAQVCGSGPSGSLGVEWVRWGDPNRWVPYVGGWAWDEVNVWDTPSPISHQYLAEADRAGYDSSYGEAVGLGYGRYHTVPY